MIHTLEPGQWLGSIAAHYGFSHWSALWDHPANAILRERRGSPDLLMAGDEVHIPTPGERPGLPVQSNRRVVFVARPPHDRVRIRIGGLAQFIAALGPVAYRLTIGAHTTEGTLDDPNGVLEAALPAEATRASLTLMGTQTYDFMVGGLGPTGEHKGAHARLVNLGFPRAGGRRAAPREGASADGAEAAIDPLVESVTAFQRAHDLTVTGTLDEPTVHRLAAEYGG